MSDITSYRGFVQQYDRYKDKIYNYFYYRLSHDRDVAEDLTSDTFVKAFENIERYDDSFAFSTWLYRIARNVLIDHFRKTKPERLDETVEIEDGSHDEFLSTLDDEIDLERIVEEVSRLPDAQQQAIHMRYFEYKEVRDIAEEHQTNEAAVRQNISRGLKRVREMLPMMILLIIPYI